VASDLGTTFIAPPRTRVVRSHSAAARASIALAVVFATSTATRADDASPAADGAGGGKCYGNGTCNAGFACADGACRAAADGAEGGRCLAHGTCDAGLACSDGRCVRVQRSTRAPSPELAARAQASIAARRSLQLASLGEAAAACGGFVGVLGFATAGFLATFDGADALKGNGSYGNTLLGNGIAGVVGAVGGATGASAWQLTSGSGEDAAFMKALGARDAAAPVRFADLSARRARDDSMTSLGAGIAAGGAVAIGTAGSFTAVFAHNTSYPNVAYATVPEVGFGVLGVLVGGALAGVGLVDGVALARDEDAFVDAL
jgi:hypothetical protein